MTPVSSDVIHSTPLHKCKICREVYIETDTEARVDICSEKTSLCLTVALQVLSKEKFFLVRTKMYLTLLCIML